MHSGNYNKDILIVVPYRNRPEHLKEFLENSPKYFDQTGYSYDILLCELDQAGDWNAGLCVNSLIDFLKSGKRYEWLYVHHVDIWPKSGTWSMPGDKEILHNLGDYGSCFMKLDYFLEVDGYCNSFWGWGGEDNELYDKLRAKGYNVISADNGTVKYDTHFQNHHRNFNGNNYGAGIKNLFLKSITERDNIKDFYNFASVKLLPNIDDNIFHQLIVPLKKSPREYKNKKALLGYIHNIKDFTYVAPFVKSALIYAPYNFDIVIIVADQDLTAVEQLINQLISFGVVVIKNSKTEQNLFIDRYKKYLEFLQDRDYEYVLHVDVTDSYFQDDPFKHLDDRSITLSSESVYIEQETWNKNMWLGFYGETIYNTIKHNKVLCGGVVGGTKNNFVNFSKKVIEEYNRLNVNTATGIDQIIIQKLIYVDRFVEINLKEVEDKFCLNLHTYAHYPDLINYKINIHCNRSITLNDTNDKFSIVHQYNRLPDLYNGVVNHFVNYFVPA